MTKIGSNYYDSPSQIFDFSNGVGLRFGLREQYLVLSICCSTGMHLHQLPLLKRHLDLKRLTTAVDVHNSQRVFISARIDYYHYYGAGFDDSYLKSNSCTCFQMRLDAAMTLT